MQTRPSRKICTDSNVGAKVRTKDDGTERCREDVCWFNSVTTQSDCDGKAKAPSGATAGFYTNWEKSYNYGNGVCIFRPWNIRLGSGEQDSDYWTWTNGFEAAKKFKAACAAELRTGLISRWSVVFSLSAMDSLSKRQCQVLQHRRQEHLRGQRDLAPVSAVCKTKGLGCGGCRKPSNCEGVTGRSGMCYRTNVVSWLTAIRSLRQYHETLPLQSTTSANDCSSPNAWVTCSEIDDDVRRRHYRIPSKVHAQPCPSSSVKPRKTKGSARAKSNGSGRLGAAPVTGDPN